MKENIFDVLMYMFENCMDEEQGFVADAGSLARKLREVGFRSDEIDKAFTWLEDLSAMCGASETDLNAGRPQSIRQYSAQEQEKLGPAAIGFIHALEQRGILEPAAREILIDRVMALETEDGDLEQLKWVVKMILYNRSEREQSYDWMEALAGENVTARLH